MPDLFDMLKDNESNFQEKPPEKAWQKLEKKLDKRRRPKRRGIRFLQTQTVVLAIVLLIFVAIAVWYFIKTN